MSDAVYQSGNTPAYRAEGKEFAAVGFKWANVRVSLLQSIDALMLEMRPQCARDRILDESKDLLQEGVNAVKARLRREEATNEQIHAAVRKSDAEVARERADERKVHAEAASIELRNSINRLRLVIGVSLAVTAVEGEVGAQQELERLLVTLDSIAKTLG